MGGEFTGRGSGEHCGDHRADAPGEFWSIGDVPLRGEGDGSDQNNSMARVIVRPWGRKTHKVRDPWRNGQTNPAHELAVLAGNPGDSRICGQRHRLLRCVFRGGGLNRSAVGKTGASFTSRRPQQLAPSTLTSLLACTNAMCRAILRHGYAWRRARPASSLPGHPALFPKRPPYPVIQSTLKQKLCPSRLRPPPLHPQGRRGLG